MTNGTSGPLDMSKHDDSKPLDEDAPLNLSMKSDSDNASVCDQPLSLTIKDKEKDGEKDLLSTYSSSASKIPSDYYASQALSGVFLAEQIRQQQLASELQNHLGGGQQSQASLTAMQALLSLGKITSNGSTDHGKEVTYPNERSISKNLGRGIPTTKPKKNTVASLLAASRGNESHPGILSNTHPELTIEPIYHKKSPRDSSYEQNEAGRRSSVFGEIEMYQQTKKFGDSPGYKNFSENLSGPGSDSGDYKGQGNSDSEDQLNSEDGKCEH